MSTIEGGMVCTNDEKVFETFRMLRSHGMVRETTNKDIKEKYIQNHPDLSPDFIFAYPAYNVRNTEIGAVLGMSQLKRLDKNNIKRRKNFELFIKNLDPQKYRTDFDLEGSCNYAFNLGNQLRQPYLKGIIPEKEFEKYPEIEHIHFYGYYIGNYPDLDKYKILDFCKLLNEV